MMFTEQQILHSILEQGEEFRVLFSQLNNGSAVHAYLVTGEKGTGKHTLSRLMAETLLCSSARNRPCGECRNCRLVSKNEHPDMIFIESGNPIAPGVRKDRATIPVEDIREMIRLCGIRSPEGAGHVVLISDADKMTPQAQNCLLKTLEEPPADTCMILLAEHTESLLSTVISRCRVIRMKSLGDGYIRSVLESRGISPKLIPEILSAADGSVGRALEIASDETYWALREETLDCFFRTASGSGVLPVSTRWKDRKQDADRLLSVLESCLRQLMEARFDAVRKTDLSEFPANWQRFSAKADPERFVLLADAVRNARDQLRFSTNFQAVLEKLIFVFMGEGNKW